MRYQGSSNRKVFSYVKVSYGISASRLCRQLISCAQLLPLLVDFSHSTDVIMDLYT